MSESRTTIAVLSEDYVRKEWSLFELNRAYTEHVCHGKDVIVIKYGSIPSQQYEDLPGLVQQILDVNAYLEWQEPIFHIQADTESAADKMREELFWDKLVSILYGQKHPCHLKTPCCYKLKGEAI